MAEIISRPFFFLALSLLHIDVMMNCRIAVLSAIWPTVCLG